MKETDLYPAIRDHLAADGFDVYAEVKGCDVVAQKADRIVIVELKTSMNLTLVRQAVERQALTHDVYVGIPEPRRVTRSVRATEQILKRLGLGLLTVADSPLRKVAHRKFEPDHDGRINTRRKNQLLKELAGRTIDPNVGGSTGTTLYTAYRETAYALAWMIAEHGEPARVRDLKSAAGTKTQSILYRNHYGWFERVATGTYDLTEEGRKALAEYPDLSVLAERQLKRD